MSEEGFCPICSGLSQEIIDKIFDCASIVNLKANQSLYLQGDPYKGVFVLSRGSIRLFNKSADGKEIFVKKISENSTLGETGMTQSKYLESALALEDSTCIFIPGDKLSAIMENSAALTLSVLNSVNKWLVDFYNRFKVLSHLNVRDRLETFLLNEAKKANSTQIEFDLKKHEIASNLGIRPETMSRTLRELTNEGLILMRGNWVDVEKLSQSSLRN